MPLYTINKFFGGMSNDDYAGPAGAVFDTKNVDVGNSKGVILSRSYDLSRPNQLFTQAQGAPVALVEGSSFTNRLIASRNGILKSFVATYDITSKTSAIYNMGIIEKQNFNSFGFVFGSNAKIYKWDVSPNSLDLGIGTGGVNITEACTLPDDVNGGTSFFSSRKSPYLIQGNIIFVTAGNGASHNVYRVDTSNDTWIVDPDYLTLDRGYYVSYMTNIGDQIVIYATNGNNGKQYFWDGVSQEYSRYIDWYDKPILGGATINNIDYVITGTNRKRALYLVNGYQPQKIFETDVYVNNYNEEKFFFDTENGISNLIETIGDTLVLPGYEYVYKFGNSKIGLPRALTRDNVFGFINLIHYNDKNSSNLVVCTQASSFDGTFKYLISSTPIGTPNNNIDLYPINKYGIVKALKFDGGIYSQEKEAVKMRVGYDLRSEDSDGDSLDMGINVYAKINDRNKYVNFYTYQYDNGSYTTRPSIGDVYTFDNQNYTVYDVSIKKQGGVEEKDLGLIIHCTCDNSSYSIEKEGAATGILTKVSGDGDATFRFYDVDEGFELVKKINSLDLQEKEKTRMTFMLNNMETTSFNEIQLKFDLYTTNGAHTPTLYEAYLQYNVIEEDLN